TMAVDYGPLIQILVGLFATRKNMKKAAFESLPDEIIIEILSRLPADFIVECRRVCKRWLVLTTTPAFAELQLMRATTVIVADCSSHRNSFYIDFNGAKKQTLLHRMRLLDCGHTMEKCSLLRQREGCPYVIFKELKAS
ncbi:hypothetical protein Tsubulata_048203, partial [Turnera subulata]